MAKVGIIGGSGLYQMEGLEKVKDPMILTLLGPPSDHFIEGILEGTEVVFLARHGADIIFPPAN